MLGLQDTRRQRAMAVIPGCRVSENSHGRGLVAKAPT